MTANAPDQSQTKLSDSEQKLLDSALLESEQFLVRSLRQDQRRRAIRWSAVALSGVMVAGLAGFTAGRVTAEKQLAVEPAETAGTSTGLGDEQWRERLLAVKEDDSWFDGAQLGMELVRIPGKRPFTILSENWDDISINGRQQILKGFSPGMMGNKVLHERFFDVMNLGMSDPNQEVRDFAATYLKMQGLPDFSRDPEGYAEWWRTNQGRPADQIKAIASKTNEPTEDADAAGSSFQRAWQLFFAREYKESEALFRNVLEDEPKNPHAMNGLGWSLINQKKYDEAKPWINRAIDIEKEHWGALSGLGVILKNEGDLDGAVAVWERIATNAEGPNDASVNLADIYFERSEFEKAAKYYRKLVQWYPEQSAFQERLAETKAKLDEAH